MSIIEQKRKITNMIRKAKTIFLMAHKDLDLDALGSSIGMSMLLKQKRKDCYLIIDDKTHELGVQKVLRELEIESIFDAIVGADSEWPLKPEPDALISLQKRYNVDLENCWVVGDNYTDLECARKAGYKSIFVRYGFGEIQDEKPNFQVDSFNEIIPILFNLK
jgi:phosphoglycolate phosphatase-like HAD superfamily hydrolase